MINLCKYQIINGKRAGEVCNRTILSADQEYCYQHRRKAHLQTKYKAKLDLMNQRKNEALPTVNDPVELEELEDTSENISEEEVNQDITQDTNQDDANQQVSEEEVTQEDTNQEVELEDPGMSFDPVELENDLFEHFASKKMKEVREKRKKQAETKLRDIENFNEMQLIEELETQVKKKNPINKGLIKSIGVRLLELDAIDEDDFNKLINKYISNN